MITAPAGTVALIGGARYTTHWRLLIEGPDGEWRDYADQQGIDWRKSADWGKTVDQSIADGRVEVFMEANGISLAPLVGGSPLNRDSLGNYAKAIDIGRRLQVWTQDTAVGSAPVEADWILEHDAIIKRVGKGSGTLQLETDDRAALLSKIIRVKRTYGSSTGTAVETVMQQIIDDNMGAGVFTLQVEGTPGYSVTEFTPHEISVWQALEKLSAEFGGYLEYKADLTLVVPDRSTPTAMSAVATIGPDQYKTLPRLDVDLESIRNVISVTFMDADDTTHTVTSEHTQSIADYREQFMGITLGEESAIDTTLEAQDMADAIRDDLAVPRYEQQIVNFYWALVELGDHITWKANGRDYDSDQHWAVTGYRHRISSDKRETVFDVRGTATAGYKRWLQKGDERPPTKLAPYGTISAYVTNDGAVSFAFSGNAIARSFAWKISKTGYPTDPTGATVVDAQSGEVSVDPAAFTLGADEKGFITGWFYPEPAGAGEIGPPAREVATRGAQGPPGPEGSTDTDLAIYNFRVVEETDEYRDYAWDTGPLVEEVWIYNWLDTIPGPANPWPGATTDPVAILGPGQNTYRFNFPDASHVRRGQVEPRMEDAGSYIAGPFRRLEMYPPPLEVPHFIYLRQTSTAAARNSDVYGQAHDPAANNTTDTGSLKVWVNTAGTASPDPSALPDAVLTVGSFPFTFGPTTAFDDGSKPLDNIPWKPGSTKTVYLELEMADGRTTGRVPLALEDKLDLVDDVGELRAGSIQRAAQFASGLDPVLVLGSVPTTHQGSDVIVSGGKLYRWDGSAYVATVPTGDLTGTIAETQITDESISTPKLAALAVTAGKIASNAVVAGKIDAGAVTAVTIAAGAVKAEAIDAGAVTTVKLSAGAVTAGKIDVVTLSAIKADLGLITGGHIQGATKGHIRFTAGYAALPTDYFIDFAGTTTGLFISHPGFKLWNNGDAEFAGKLSAASGTFAGTVSGSEFTADRAVFAKELEVQAGQNTGVFRAIAPAVSLVTSIMLMYDGGGGMKLQTVRVGAADSGGSGYRTLIVPNA